MGIGACTWRGTMDNRIQKPTCYCSFLWALAFRMSKSSTSTDPLGVHGQQVMKPTWGRSIVDSELNNIQILSPEEYKERKEKSKRTRKLFFIKIHDIYCIWYINTEISGAYGTHGREQKRKQGYGGETWRKEHVNHLDAYVRTILK
jgi:hypothetical protein